jgi:hypothetical protein
MLFLASRILKHELNDASRLRLLETLSERQFVPLIRSTRLSCYEQVLSHSDQVREMERLIVTLIDAKQEAPYVQGDLFCFDDHTCFLLFEDLEDGTTVMRAGIVYEPQMIEPLRKLNSFCQTISFCLADASVQLDENMDEGSTQLSAWRQEPSAAQEGFMRFVARQDADALSTIACREQGRDRVRAAKLLEDDHSRLFLRRAREAYAEGYHITPSSDAMTVLPEFSVNRLLEAGLLQREVLVSCRKTGHTLMSLPSADSLAVMTISHASCSECGVPVSDESIEEVFAPTKLSALLLEDGAWLVNRFHSMLREMGIAASEIAVERPSGDGEARMLARMCGESFLIVMRDGDLTPAFARRAINAKIETEAPNLLVVVTETIHNEGRLSLLGFAKRLKRSGNDFELIIAEGVGAAEAELRRAFERVSQRVLAEHLCKLDDSLGLSAAHLITARFQMLRKFRDAAQPAQLPAPVEHGQDLQKMAQAVSLIEF